MKNTDKINLGKIKTEFFNNEDISTNNGNISKYANMDPSGIKFKRPEYNPDGPIAKYANMDVRTEAEKRAEYEKKHKNDAPPQKTRSFEHSKIYDNKVNYEGAQTGYVKKQHLDPEQLNRQAAEFSKDFTHVDDSEAARGSKSLRKDLNQLGIGYKNQHHLTAARIGRVVDIVNETGPSKALEDKFLKAEIKSDKHLLKEFRKMSVLERNNILKDNGFITFKDGYTHTASEKELALLELSKNLSTKTSYVKLDLVKSPKSLKADPKHTFRDLKTNIKQNASTFILNQQKKSEILKKVEENSRTYHKNNPEDREAFVKSFGANKKGEQNYKTKTNRRHALKDLETNIKLIDNKLAQNGVFVKDLSDNQLLKTLKTGKLGEHYLTNNERKLIQERLRLGRAKRAAAAAKKGKFERGKNIIKTAGKTLDDTDAAQGYQMSKNVIKTTRGVYKSGKTVTRGVTVGINNLRYANVLSQNADINRKLKNLTKQQKRIEKLSGKAATPKNLARLEKSKAKIKKIGNGETNFLKIQKNLREQQSPLTRKLLQRDSQNASLHKGLIKSAWNSKPASFVKGKIKDSKAGQFTTEQIKKTKKKVKSAIEKLKKSKAGTFVSSKIAAAKAAIEALKKKFLESRIGKISSKAAKVLGKGFKKISAAFDFLRNLKKKIILCGGAAVLMLIIITGMGDNAVIAIKTYWPWATEESEAEEQTDDTMTYKKSNNKKGIDYGATVMQSYLTALMKPESAKYDNILPEVLQGRVNAAIATASCAYNLRHMQTYMDDGISLKGYEFSLYKEPYNYSASIIVYDEYHKAWTEHTGKYHIIVVKYDSDGNVIKHNSYALKDDAVKYDSEGNLVEQYNDSEGNIVKQYNKEYTIYHSAYWDYHTETLSVQGYNGISGDLGNYTSSGIYDKKESIRNSSQWNNTWTEYSMELEIYGKNGNLVSSDEFFKQLLIMQIGIVDLDEDSATFFKKYTAHLIKDILEHAKINLEVYQMPVGGKTVTFSYTDPLQKDTQYFSAPALKNVVKMHVQIDGYLLENLFKWDTTTNADVHSSKWQSKHFKSDVSWPGWTEDTTYLPKEYELMRTTDSETFNSIFGKLNLPKANDLIPSAFGANYI